MKRVSGSGLAILCGVISLGFSAPASAQAWSGAYAGVHAGYRWGIADLSRPAYPVPDGFGGTSISPASSERYETAGAIGGAHAGYNLALSPGLLIGIEADISAGRDKDTRYAQLTSSQFIGELEEFVTITQNRTSSFELGPQGSLRARLGLVAGPWLLYTTGGVAFTRAEWTDTFSVVVGPSASVSKSDTLTGWVAGAGAETFVAPGWLVRTEYLYEDFGRMTVPLAFTSRTGTLDLVAHKLRAGVSFKF
jgi:opacity protein-like surface antigen